MVACLSMVACTTVKEGNSLDQCNVVASKVVTDGDTLVVCDVSKIEQHIKLPLSTLVKNWKLLKLENTSKEALVLPAYIYPSENYILIHPVEFNRGAMLFDKTGKYLFDIGRKGNGPGEIVTHMSYIAMDEDNDCVYIRDHKPSRILKYRLSTGEYLAEIPLAYPKAFDFILNPKNKSLILTNPPNHRIEQGIPWVWEQDFQGNILQELPQKIYNRNLEYRFWIWSRNNKIVFFDYNLPGRKDTLCHYGIPDNRLKPHFTVDFGSEVPNHQYEDTSDFYLATIISEAGMGKPFIPTKRILIDKKTLKGAYVDIVLDGYGDFSITQYWTSLKSNYFTLGLEPHQVAETCEKLLAHPENLTQEEKQNLQELLDGITEDDNAFILYGKI
jgi:hypothetical protein